MSVYDHIRCRCPLPGYGEALVDEVFFTRDTEPQMFDEFEIRADGTFWHQTYDVVDRSDPSLPGIAGIVGIMAQENFAWVQEFPSGSISFWSGSGRIEPEFVATFLEGLLTGIQQIGPFEATRSRRNGC